MLKPANQHALVLPSYLILHVESFTFYDHMYMYT